MESKHEKFTRLRDGRLPKALAAIQLLGNLGGPAYEASPEERSAIVRSLQDELDTLAIALCVDMTSAQPAVPPAANTTTDPALLEVQRQAAAKQPGWDKVAEAYECLREALGS